MQYISKIDVGANLCCGHAGEEDLQLPFAHGQKTQNRV